MLEKSHGSREALEELLKRAVTYCPQAEILWLMAAKEAWLGGEVDKARNILSEAFAANPDNEDIWLAAFKLEFENQEPERARMILQKARDTETASTRRVWMKSAMVERELDNAQGERALLQQGLERFPDFDKLHLMLGQLEERTGNLQGRCGVYVAVGVGRLISSAATQHVDTRRCPSGVYRGHQALPPEHPPVGLCSLPGGTFRSGRQGPRAAGAEPPAQPGQPGPVAGGLQGGAAGGQRQGSRHAACQGAAGALLCLQSRLL